MSGRVMEMRNDRLHVEVIVAGRGKPTVNVYGPSVNGERPLVHVDYINLADAKARERLASVLPPELRDDFELIARELGAKLAQLAAVSPAPSSNAHDDEGKTELEPWPEPVEGAALLDEIRALLERYVVLPPHGTIALALWVAHTYAINAAAFTPYVWVSSPVRECGKSTLLDLLEAVVLAPRKNDGISPAALFRMIEAERPTMLLDELDTQLKADDSAQSLRGVLNSGFKRGATFTRCVGDQHEVRHFSTFCPKVLAGIGALWDTVASRSIPIPMERATKAQVRRLTVLRGDRIMATCEAFRRRALRWAQDAQDAQDALDALADADAAVPEALGARQADIWRALFAIADDAGGEWPNAARAAAVALHAGAPETKGHEETLLADIRDIFELFPKDRLDTELIIQRLLALEGHPWAEWGNHRRPITPHTLAKLLAAFGIHPSANSGGQKRGYYRSAFEQAWEKYLSPLSWPTAATAATASARSRETVDAAVAAVPADGYDPRACSVGGELV
jgi:hypothetical protein